MKKLILLMIMLSPFMLLDIALAEEVDTQDSDNSGYEEADYGDRRYNNNRHRHGGRWSGNMNFLIGEEEVSDKDWEGLKVDSLTTLGFKWDFKEESWPVSIAIDLYWSEDSNYSVAGGFRTDVVIEELAFGVRKIIEAGPGFNLYFGGGVTLVTTTMEFDFGDIVLSDDDSDIGQWLEAGLYVTLSEEVNLGLMVRYLDAEAILFDEADDLAGIQTGAFIGVHF